MDKVEYDKIRYEKNKDIVKKRTSLYRKNNLDKKKIYTKRYKDKYPEKIKAKGLAQKLPSLKCSISNCNKIGQKHHHDYTKPLEIIYLCSQHHSDVHNDKMSYETRLNYQNELNILGGFYE